MKYFPALLSLIFILIVVSLPNAVSAVGPGGLVPCDGKDCGSCEVVKLAQNVMKWLIGVLMVVFAIMAAIAGFGLVTSGGNPSAKADAKKKMTNAIIGLIIVLAAWLLVDTIMKALLAETGGKLNGFLWSEIECKGQNPLSIGKVVISTPSTGTSTPSTCQPLSALSDPLALRMEAGETVIWEGTDPNLRACAEALPGHVTSAYRPQAYQDHFKEIHRKWCDEGLQANNDPACSAVKTQVGGEMTKHQLSCGRPVASVSNHTAGIAVDISQSRGPQPPSTCMQWFGTADPVHYTLIPGCSCE